MAAGTQSYPTTVPEEEPADTPELSVCETSPGTSVFLEAGNTDGWIASDVTVEVTR
ncbi:hypothetical protein [Halorarius halobius]|uniref:hypothetical protein n=1 Tax=Halorarius halobius TaxID=2962671 RepID=UPI0020CD1B40|nr:hypothetical protein [Halorarius halobius]